MGPRVAETGLITTSALTIIVVLAVVTIIGVIWGIRLKRQRDTAQASEIERVEAEGGTPMAPGAPIDEPAAVPSPAPEVPRARAPAPPAPVVAPLTQSAEEPADPAPLHDEPIPAAAPLDASPATVADPSPAAEPEPAASAGPPPGDGPVTLLKGLGPKVAARLADLGVMTVGDLAALDGAQAETIDARLGPFTGRMARDRWIEQARFLAAGDVKGFEAVFGKL